MIRDAKTCEWRLGRHCLRAMAGVLVVQGLWYASSLTQLMLDS